MAVCGVEEATGDWSFPSETTPGLGLIMVLMTGAEGEEGRWRGTNGDFCVSGMGSWPGTNGGKGYGDVWWERHQSVTQPCTHNKYSSQTVYSATMLKPVRVVHWDTPLTDVTEKTSETGHKSWAMYLYKGRVAIARLPSYIQYQFFPRRLLNNLSHTHTHTHTHTPGGKRVGEGAWCAGQWVVVAGEVVSGY